MSFLYLQYDIIELKVSVWTHHVYITCTKRLSVECYCNISVFFFNYYYFKNKFLVSGYFITNNLKSCTSEMCLINWTWKLKYFPFCQITLFILNTNIQYFRNHYHYILQTLFRHTDMSLIISLNFHWDLCVLNNILLLYVDRSWLWPDLNLIIYECTYRSK